MIYSINLIIIQLLIYNINRNNYNKFASLLNDYHSNKDYNINYKFNNLTILAYLLLSKKTRNRSLMIKLLLSYPDINLKILNNYINYLEYAIIYNDNEITKSIFKKETGLLNFYVLESSKKNNYMYNYLTNFTITNNINITNNKNKKKTNSEENYDYYSEKIIKSDNVQSNSIIKETYI